MRKNIGFILIGFLFHFPHFLGAQPAKTIQVGDNLSPGLTITLVESIKEGSSGLLSGTTRELSDLPDFERICITSRPAPRSNIRIEVWLPPAEQWNGRFLGTGNGGGAGNISYGMLASGLKRGFAVTNTDMGTFPNANDHADNPEVWKDFGYRATHEMTIAGKLIVEKHYGRKADYSYFIGCSTGGQQSLSEAQRFPEDYDGIIAGAPANNRTHLHTLFLWNHQWTNREPGRTFTREELEKITEAIVKTNAGKDGGAPTDTFLTDPRSATLDFASLDFLTPKQIEALEKIFQGPVNPRTGERIYTSFPLGSESAPSGLGNHQDISMTQAHFYPFFWAFGRDYDFMTFDFDKDMDRVDSKLASFLNANDPNLESFKKQGGKLLMYTGTSDPIVPMEDAIHYYERVVEEQGGLENTQQFFRFFIVPGMYHCSGGPAPNDFGQQLPAKYTTDPETDLMTAMINWVENGKAPEQFIARSYATKDGQREITAQRPLFPYPLFPHYTGGNAADPTNFEPRPRARGNVPVPADRYLK